MSGMDERIDSNRLAENFGHDYATQEYLFNNPTDFDITKEDFTGKGSFGKLNSEKTKKGIDEKIEMEGGL